MASILYRTKNVQQNGILIELYSSEIFFIHLNFLIQLIHINKITGANFSLSSLRFFNYFPKLATFSLCKLIYLFSRFGIN